MIYIHAYIYIHILCGWCLYDMVICHKDTNGDYLASKRGNILLTVYITNGSIRDDVTSQC